MTRVIRRVDTLCIFFPFCYPFPLLTNAVNATRGGSHDYAIVYQCVNVCLCVHTGTALDYARSREGSRTALPGYNNKPTAGRHKWRHGRVRNWGPLSGGNSETDTFKRCRHETTPSALELTSVLLLPSSLLFSPSSPLHRATHTRAHTHTHTRVRIHTLAHTRAHTPHTRAHNHK